MAYGCLSSGLLDWVIFSVFSSYSLSLSIYFCFICVYFLVLYASCYVVNITLLYILYFIQYILYWRYSTILKLFLFDCIKHITLLLSEFTIVNFHLSQHFNSSFLSSISFIYTIIACCELASILNVTPYVQELYVLLFSVLMLIILIATMQHFLQWSYILFMP